MDASCSPQVSGVEAHAEGAAAEKRALFQALFHAHYDYVWASLRRLGVPDRDREDVTHELFVKVHQRWDSFDQARPARPWLFAFAVRMASDYRNLSRHHVETFGVTAPEAASALPSPHDSLLEEERRRLVLAALEALDLDKRAVVVLHDLDETPIPEVARALAIPEGTAYTRLRSGRAELAAALRRLTKEKSS